MTAALAIAKRELAAAWRTPVGWIAAALYAALTGAVFVAATLAPGEPASLRYFFGPSGWLLIAVVPALSMGLFSEDERSGNDENLRASPISSAGLAAGKTLGAAASLALMLAPTLAFPITLIAISKPMPDLGAITGGYAGLLLVGWAYLGLGAVCSAATSSQTVAYLAALIALIASQLGATLLTPLAPTWAEPILVQLSIQARLADFARGLIDSAHVLTLAATAAGMTMLAGCVHAWRGLK